MSDELQRLEELIAIYGDARVELAIRHLLRSWDFWVARKYVEPGMPQLDALFRPRLFCWDLAEAVH